MVKPASAAETFGFPVGVAAALACAVVSGCQFNVHTGGNPSVPKADLEKSISDKFGADADKPQSVTCPSDLEGEVDKTTECEVNISDTNQLQVIVHVDKLEGTTVGYTMTPALTQAQVAKAVTQYLASNNNGVEPQSVTCDARLEGKQDTASKCDVVDPTGETFGQTVTVKSVDGLLINLHIASD